MMNRRNTGLFAITALTILGMIAWAAPALAQNFNISNGIVGNLSCIASGDCGWCDFIDLMVVLQKVILSLFGGLAIIMLVWGGQGLIMSGGSSEKVAASKKLITSTLFGVLIVLAGYALITLLIAVLTNPVGSRSLQSNIFGTQAWQRAFCKPSSDPKFCAERGEGTPCVVGGESGFCKQDVCVTACAYALGDGASCQDIASTACNTSGATTEARRLTCREPNCKLDVCSGGLNTVCCKP